MAFNRRRRALSDSMYNDTVPNSPIVTLSKPTIVVTETSNDHKLKERSRKASSPANLDRNQRYRYLHSPQDVIHHAASGIPFRRNSPTREAGHNIVRHVSKSLHGFLSRSPEQGKEDVEIHKQPKAIRNGKRDVREDTTYLEPNWQPSSSYLQREYVSYSPNNYEPSFGFADEREPNSRSESPSGCMEGAWSSVSASPPNTTNLVASPHHYIDDADDPILPEDIDVDVDEISLSKLSTQQPSVRRVITRAAQNFIPRSDYNKQHNPSRYIRNEAKLTPAHSLKSTLSDAPSDDEADHHCCSEAQRAVDHDPSSVFFCHGCRAIFCDSHWKSQISHKGKGSRGHERTKISVARWVHATLEARSSEEIQALKHLEDKNSALWFGAGPDERGTPVFRDFERYSLLMSERASASKGRCFPAMVSFVGETGAGKSSLIKLLISMFNNERSQKTPVVGSAKNDHTPTSGDVHLYCDPQTFDTPDPILYADCEGLNGGTREPIAAKYKRRRSGNLEARHTQDSALRRHLREDIKTSEREILWADTPEKASREFFVRNFYPRLLYTFSDVIVFVVKNFRTIESILEQLIKWADAVLETSSNQPVLPHAIIVLNASSNHDQELWDIPNATADLLDSLEEVLETSNGLKRHMHGRRKRSFNAKTIKQLIESYYTSIRVIRIPTGDHPNLLRDQVDKLYSEIRDCTKQSLNFKLSVRMKLSSDELLPYLHSAFEHFCTTLEKPFDFVKASHANCSIPSDFSGNILKLALSFMEFWANRLDGPLIFKELSFILASCSMVDAVRRGILGLAESVFPTYAVHFEEALEDFSDRYWACEYVCAEGRCVNVRAGHSKGHQIASGKVVEPNAPYRSSFEAVDYRMNFLNDIYQNLAELLRKLGHMKKQREMDEKEAAIELHREYILKHFYRHLGNVGEFFSHSLCLACLVFAPQHCLPCGHILCTPCLEAYGRRRGPGAISISSCPVEMSSNFDSECIFAIQPETVGLRVLTLDGGGIRGILELVTLQHIETALGGSLRIQSFFDLIIGTSTGGIIALGLGEKNWSVSESSSKFCNLAYQVFARSKGLSWRGTEIVLEMLRHGKYDARPMERALIAQFGQDRLFGGPREQTVQMARLRPRVAVTATSMDGRPYVFGNYNRANASNAPSYEFLRAEKPGDEIKIHEAARATSAAPKIFKPFHHDASKLTFLDGGIYHNNPIEVAMQELALLSPTPQSHSPDLVLSLGTGHPDKGKKERVPISVAKTGPLGYFKNLKKVAVDHIKHSLDSEKKWNDFLGKQGENTKGRYYRINYDLGDRCPKLDDVASLRSLEKLAHEQIKGKQAEINDIADRLIATSFYFRPSRKPRKLQTGVLMHGHFECRFPSNSDEISALGRLLRNRQSEIYNRQNSGSLNQENMSFVFEERRKEKDAKQIFVSRQTVRKMIEEGQFLMPEQTFEISNELANVDIYFCFGSESYQRPHNSISGFPCRWEPDLVPNLQPSLSLSRKRVSELQKRKSEWSKPADRSEGLLDLYAINDLPGLATQKDIHAVEQRLKEPDTTPSPILTRSRDVLRDSEGPIGPIARIFGKGGDIRKAREKETASWVIDQQQDPPDEHEPGPSEPAASELFGDVVYNQPIISLVEGERYTNQAELISPTSPSPATWWNPLVTEDVPVGIRSVTAATMFPSRSATAPVPMASTLIHRQDLPELDGIAAITFEMEDTSKRVISRNFGEISSPVLTFF